MTGDLKPCPFCGCTPTLDRFNARCHGCDAEINAAPGLAADLWNRRAPSPAVARLVEIARTFLDNYRSRRRADKEAGRAVQGAFIYDDLAEALAAVEKEIQP